MQECIPPHGWTGLVSGAVGIPVLLDAAALEQLGVSIISALHVLVEAYRPGWCESGRPMSSSSPFNSFPGDSNGK